MKTNNQLVIIRKIEKYIEYMITILIKLPRTEKFSIGTEIKTSMYEILKNILFATKIEEDKRFILKMDALQPPKVQSIEKWIDMQKYK